MKPSAAGHFALDDGAGSIKLEIRVQWIIARLDQAPA